MKSILDHQILDISISREVGEAVDGLSLRTDFTTVIPPDSDTVLNQLGINYIDNSDKDFSTDAYVNTVPVGGDTADECYNFYRQRFVRITDGVLVAASTNLASASAPFKSSYTYPMLFFALRAGTSEKALLGTITRVDDSNATMSLVSVFSVTDAIVFFGDSYATTAARALKSSGHSLFATETANDSIARWDEAAGQTEIGGDGVDNFDIVAPLPFNLATRGLDLFFSVNVKLRTGVMAFNPIVLFAGIYDTTSGNEKFLEADNFSLTVNYIGTAGTEDYECIVIGTFSNGEQVASDIVTINNVTSSLNATDFLDWDWENAPRILDFALYRKDINTGIVVRVFTIYNGETRFFDKNTSGEETVASFPTAPARREYAYAESIPFIPLTEYRRVPIFFRIPPTYLQSSTTGRQILRIGVYNVVANDVRPLLIDRVMLSLTESVWNRSARDLERVSSTAPTSGTPDGNQGNCFVGDTPIIVKEKPNEDWKSIPIRNANRGMFIYNGNQNDRIVDVKEGKETRLFQVEMDNYIFFECTASERFITSPSDKNGTRLDRLGVGDVISTTVDGVNFQSKIKRIKPVIYTIPQKVYTISLERDKIFIVGSYRLRWWRNPIKWFRRRAILGGTKAHNRKQNDYDL